MVKTIKMYGRTFEVKRKSGVYEGLVRFKNIYACYKNPSQIKMEIYHDWSDYFRSNLPLVSMFGSYGIASYNTNVFTFDCVYRAPKAILHFHITPAHNYLTIYELPFRNDLPF